MKVATFCGKCSTLGITGKYMRHDLVLVDLDYNDGIPELPGVVMWRSEIPPGSLMNEMYERRMRIAKSLLKVVQVLGKSDDLLILDSDVFLTKQVNFDRSGIIATYAKMKPLEHIALFETPSNYFIKKEDIDTFYSTVDQYVRLELYRLPVDVWIGTQLLVKGWKVYKEPGVCHIIDGKIYCT